MLAANVDLRNNTAKKVLEPIINKSYVPVFADKTASTGTCLQDRVPIVRTVSVTFASA